MQGHLSAYVNGEKSPNGIHFTYKHITVVLVDIQLTYKADLPIGRIIITCLRAMRKDMYN